VETLARSLKTPGNRMGDNTMEIEYRGMTLRVWEDKDRAGRSMWYVTVDGETIARGYGMEAVIDRAKGKLA